MDNRQKISEILTGAGFPEYNLLESQAGFIILEEETDGLCLADIDERFSVKNSEGLIIFPNGFGDWEPMKSAAEKYTQTLTEKGISARTLLQEHSWNFAAYVFVKPN